MAEKTTISVEQGPGLLRRAAGWATMLGLGPGGSRGMTFSGLVAPLPKLAAGNPATAQELYRGTFAFAGQRIDCHPAEVFAAPPPSAAWAEELLAFAWLTDLASPGLALYRAFARSLVASFFAQKRRGSFEARCRRLTALSFNAGFLMTGATAGFEAKFLRDAGREAHALAAIKARGPANQLHQAAALLAAGLAFRGGASLRDDALARLGHVVPQLILSDGGPADRSPKSLLAVLGDLIPLRQAMDAQRIAIPDDVNVALERALPMLRMLCHGDGGLALFHGVDDTSIEACRAVLASDEVRGRPLSHAALAGYCRLNQADTSVIVDCGPEARCDSPLAFEFSVAGQRIAGGCGFPVNATPAWAAAACGPAAHSTLTIEGDGAGNIHSFFARRPRRISQSPIGAELIASPHGTLMKGRNSTYALRWGIVHLRELFLAAGGRDFRGEDSFARTDHRDPDWPDARFALRFHLHPAIRANLDRNHSSVTLTLPDKSIWQFTARGGVMGLEESVFLATGGPPRPSQQVVIRGQVGRPQRVNWAFRRI
jgi:uncharacterized heparinase superfamily protein